MSFKEYTGRKVIREEVVVIYIYIFKSYVMIMLLNIGKCIAYGAFARLPAGVGRVHALEDAMCWKGLK